MPSRCASTRPRRCVDATPQGRCAEGGRACSAARCGSARQAGRPEAGCAGPEESRARADSPKSTAALPARSSHRQPTRRRATRRSASKAAQRIATAEPETLTAPEQDIQLAKQSKPIEVKPEPASKEDVDFLSSAINLQSKTKLGPFESEFDAGSEFSVGAAIATGTAAATGRTSTGTRRFVSGIGTGSSTTSSTGRSSSIPSGLRCGSSTARERHADSGHPASGEGRGRRRRTRCVQLHGCRAGRRECGFDVANVRPTW